MSAASSSSSTLAPARTEMKITADAPDLIDGKVSAAMTAQFKFIELVGNVIGGNGVWHIIGRN